MNLSSASNVSPGIRRVGLKTFVKWPVSVSSFRFTFAPLVGFHLILRSRTSPSRSHITYLAHIHLQVCCISSPISRAFRLDALPAQSGECRESAPSHPGIVLQCLCDAWNRRRIILAPDSEYWRPITELAHQPDQLLERIQVHGRLPCVKTGDRNGIHRYSNRHVDLEHRSNASTVNDDSLGELTACCG